MFSFVLSLIVLSAMFTFISSAAFLIRSIKLRGREGMMYPFWIIILIIAILPLRFHVPAITDHFSYTDTAGITASNNISGQVEYSDANTTQDKSSSPIENKALTVKNLIVMKLRRMAAASAEYADDAAGVLFILWLAGALFSVASTVLKHVKTHRLMRCHSSVCQDKRILQTFECLQEKMHLRRKVEVRMFDIDLLSSPCTGGILKPILYISQNCTGLDSRKLECVLTHELTHIKRFDTASRLFCFLVVCVHWFNPTSYRVQSTFIEDCELSCDYSVIRGYGTGISPMYMEAIIDLAQHCSENCKSVFREKVSGGLFLNQPSGMTFLKRRYANMKNFKKDYPTVALIALFTVISAIGSMLALSSCSAIDTNTLGTAIKLSPPVDIMVRAYYDLDSEDYITPEMVDGITSVRLEAKTLSTGQTAVHFTVNGDNRFTSPLPTLAKVNYMEQLIMPGIGKYADTAPDDKIAGRFAAYYCIKDINNEELTQSDKNVMLADIPDLEKYGCVYMLDPFSTEREINKLTEHLGAAGLLEPWILSSTEFDASSFGYFENLETVEFVGLSPSEYNFPDNVSVYVTDE